MQAVRKSRPEAGFDLVDAPEPVLGPGDVLVEVAATSLCGVDRHVFDWDAAGQAFVPHLPIILGHETSGTVIGVSEEHIGLAVGDRVALESHLVCGACRECRTGLAHLCTHQKILGLSHDGGFASLVSVPATACFVLPDSVTFEEAALFEPAGVAVHATQRAGSLTGRTVLVSGCGPIGLLLVELAAVAGAAMVIAVEVSAGRRAMAEVRGALTIDPMSQDVPEAVRRLVPDGVDVAFEASGAPAALQAALLAVRVAGEVVTVGHPGIVSVDVSRLINVRYITMRGVFGRRLWDTWQLLGDLVATARLDLKPFISDTIPLALLPEAITGLGDAGKVLVIPE